MRIIGGAWRGRGLVAPAGAGTRPTADRVRQAVFDRLMHAGWAQGESGRPVLEGAVVLDAFAGTGAMGLEALSRGAGRAVFMERERGALAALRANVAACGAEGMCRVVAGDVLRAPAGEGCGVAFLDPPYGMGLAGPAVAALMAAGWVGEGALVVVEVGRDEGWGGLGVEVARFTAGAAAVMVVRV